MNSPIIVFGKSSTNSLGVVRAFGRRNIPVYYLCTDSMKGATSQSKYLSGIECIDGWSDEAVLGYLERFKQQHPDLENIVVFPANDDSLVTLSNIRDKIDPCYIHSMASDELISAFINKNEFYRLMAKHNFPHPKTLRFEDYIDNPDAITEHLRFPFALKPINSYIFEEVFEAKLIKIFSLEEFDHYKKILLDQKMDVVIQEFIPGNDIYMIYFYISKDHKVRAVCGYNKLRQFPPFFGTGSLVESFWNDDLIAKTMDFMVELGYTGIGEAEYKYDPIDKTHKLLEVNVRSSTQNRLPARLGADAEFLYYQDALGSLNGSEAYMVKTDSVKWVDFEKEIRSVVQLLQDNEISIGEAIKGYRNIKVDGYFASDDWRPFFRKCFEMFRALFSKAVRLFKRS